MAQQAKIFPGRVSYDWDTWLNGSVWELQQGVDFTAKVSSVRSAAVNYGKRYGFKVKTVAKGDKLYVQAMKDMKDGNVKG